MGLPARGKTYISRKLSRYLNWIGLNTRFKGKIFYKIQKIYVKIRKIFVNSQGVQSGRVQATDGGL